MKTVRLGLSFVEVPEGELAGPPRAHVYVKYLCLGNFGDIDGKPVLTHECVTAEEIECQIDELKRELDALKADARRKFTAASKRDWDRWTKKQGEKK